MHNRWDLEWNLVSSRFTSITTLIKLRQRFPSSAGRQGNLLDLEFSTVGRAPVTQPGLRLEVDWSYGIDPLQDLFTPLLHHSLPYSALCPLVTSFAYSLFHTPHQENNFFPFLLLPLILANYCKKQQTTPEAEHRLVHRFHIFFFNSLTSALNERIYNHTQVSQEIILAACLLNQQEKRINKMKSEKKSSI